MARRCISRLQLLPTTESAIKARKILEDTDVNPQIDTLIIHASIDQDPSDTSSDWDWPRPSWDIQESRHEAQRWRGEDVALRDGLQGIEIDGVLSDTFKAMLRDIGLFRNLHRVELKHHFEVAGTSEMSDYSGNQREGVEYRDAFLLNFFRALNHPEHPATNLRTLSICNLQNHTNLDIVQSADFKSVMSRLDSLELGIAVEENNPKPMESDLFLPERHRFFGRDLQEYWLKPVQHHLVNLKLYCCTMWGYFPKCDLRDLHFPRLRSLALGNMTFTHDWQLEWILSHSQTLKSLTLDDCPIVHEAETFSELDSDRYAILQADFGLPSNVVWGHWKYNARWHEYFRRLEHGLPHLIHLGVGHGAWTGCLGEDNLTSAFEAASQLPAELTNLRYFILSCGTMPTPWIEPSEGYHDHRAKIVNQNEQYEDCCWGDEVEGGRPAYPDCWDEDQAALDELLVAMERRKLSADTEPMARA